jgi:hypothetical protein
MNHSPGHPRGHRGQHHANIAERVHGPHRADQPPHVGTDFGVVRPYNCTYKVQGITPLAGQATSNPYPVYWPVGGIVREIYGTVQSPDLADNPQSLMQRIGVTITILDGREDIFKSAAAAGSAGADFNRYASLFGLNGERRFILQRPIYAALAWQVRFTNFGSSDDGDLTPDLTFFVDEDPHGTNRVHYNRVQVPEGVEIEVYGPSGSRYIDSSDIR